MNVANTNGVPPSPQLTPHVSSSSDDEGLVRTSARCGACLRHLQQGA